MTSKDIKKGRWPKKVYIVYLFDRKLWQKTSSCLEATSQEEAEYISRITWGRNFKILEVKESK